MNDLIDRLREYARTRKGELAELITEAADALERQTCEDAVSRQAAIDALNVGAELLRRVLDDADIVGAERAKYEWGLGLIESSISDMKELPSAQPDIVRCGQCKYAEVADKEDAQDGYTCQFHRGSVWFSGSYCSWAERRTMCDLCVGKAKG